MFVGDSKGVPTFDRGSPFYLPKTFDLHQDDVYIDEKEMKIMEKLVQQHFDEIREAKKVFEEGYHGNSVFMDLRWADQMEGLFIDQLEKMTRQVSKGEFTSETIGEYVIAFFVARNDDGEFGSL